MSCQLLMEEVDVNLSRPKAMTYDQVVEHCDALRDDYVIILSWECNFKFKQTIARWVKGRCKYVNSAYVCDGKLFIRLTESNKKSPEIMERAVLYEVGRILRNQPPEILRPGRASRGNARYNNRRRRYSPLPSFAQ